MHRFKTFPGKGIEITLPSVLTFCIPIKLHSDLFEKPGEQLNREAKKPLAIKTRHGVLIPDDLSGLAYPTTPKKTYRFLAWEQDRATESLNAIELKMLCYLDVLRRRSYEEHWGITSLYVLIITTAPQRMRNMIDLLERLTRNEPQLRPFFLFKFKTDFANEWTPPPVMLDLLIDPWEQAALPPFDLLRA